MAAADQAFDLRRTSERLGLDGPVDVQKGLEKEQVESSRRLFGRSTHGVWRGGPDARGQPKTELARYSLVASTHSPSGRSWV
jgi:hypothetical protein